MKKEIYFQCSDGSGCACSSVVIAGYVKTKLLSGELKEVLVSAFFLIKIKYNKIIEGVISYDARNEIT